MSQVSSDLEIVAEVDWQFGECARACTEIAKYRLASGFSRIVRGAFTVIIIAVLILTTVVAFTSDTGAGTYLATMAPWILLLLIFLGLRFGGAGWLGAWQIRRNNPNMVSGMRHAISAASYRIQCGQIQSTVQWTGFLRLVETKRFFFAFPIKSGDYYLPKRVLTAEQCASIRSIFEEQGAGQFLQRAA